MLYLKKHSKKILWLVIYAFAHHTSLMAIEPIISGEKVDKVEGWVRTGALAVKLAPSIFQRGTEVVGEQIKTIEEGPRRLIHKQLFSGTLERVFKRKLLRRPIVSIWSPKDQEDLSELTKAIGITFIPEFEVVIDLSNENIDTWGEVRDRIDEEKNSAYMLLEGEYSDLERTYKRYSLDPKNVTLQQVETALEAVLQEQAAKGKAFKQQKLIDLTTIKKFESLKNENITVLRLGRNHIRQIPNGILQQYPNLKAIDLGSNAIEEIDAAAFAGLPKLSVLILSDNMFATLPVESLRDSKNLSFLSIAKTPLARKNNFSTGKHLAKTKLGKKLNIRSKLVFGESVDNVEALQKAFPKAHIRTMALLTRTALVSMIKSLGGVVILLLVMTTYPLIGKLFGVDSQMKTAGEAAAKTTAALPPAQSAAEALTAAKAAEKAAKTAETTAAVVSAQQSYDAIIAPAVQAAQIKVVLRAVAWYLAQLFLGAAAFKVYTTQKMRPLIPSLIGDDELRSY